MALRPHRLGTGLWSPGGGNAGSVLKRGRSRARMGVITGLCLAPREGASGRAGSARMGPWRCLTGPPHPGVSDLSSAVARWCGAWGLAES